MTTDSADPKRDARRQSALTPPQQGRRPEDVRSEEPEFVDEADLPPGEPSGQPTRNTKPHLPSERKP